MSTKGAVRAWAFGGLLAIASAGCGNAKGTQGSDAATGFAGTSGVTGNAGVAGTSGVPEGSVTATTDGGSAGSSGGGAGSSGDASHSGGSDGGAPQDATIADSAPPDAVAPAGCASGLVCNGHCVAADDIHHCGGCSNDCADLPNVAAAGLACVGGQCVYTCAAGFTACDDAGAGCPVDLSGSSRSGTTYCGSCAIICDRTGASPNCAPKSDAGTFACAATCPPEAPTMCTQDCVDLATNANNCGSCTFNCATQVANAHATCDAGTCGFGCNPGYTVCGGACVDVTTDPANCGACGAACGTNEVCQAGACSCLLTCGGACVDPDVDPQNCGACGHDCLGAACSGGMCQPIVLATGQATPWCLAVDSQSINWTNYYGPNVMRADLDGGNQVVLAVGTEPFGIAVDSANVYWTDGNDGILWESPVDGGAKVALFSGSYRNELTAVGVHGSLVYWAEDSSGIYSILPDGGASATVASYRYVNSACQIAFDDDRVYWAAYPGQDAVAAAPLDGGASEGGSIAILAAIPSMLGDTSAIAVDGTNAYFSQWTIGKVLSVPLVGGPVTTLSTTAGSPQAVVTDGRRVYWADAEGTIRSVPVGGGPEIVHATQQADARDLVLDDKAIYWVNQGDGTVMKVAR